MFCEANGTCVNCLLKKLSIHAHLLFHSPLPLCQDVRNVLMAPDKMLFVRVHLKQSPPIHILQFNLFGQGFDHITGSRGWINTNCLGLAIQKVETTDEGVQVANRLSVAQRQKTVIDRRSIHSPNT